MYNINCMFCNPPKIGQFQVTCFLFSHINIFQKEQIKQFFRGCLDIYFILLRTAYV